LIHINTAISVVPYLFWRLIPGELIEIKKARLTSARLDNETSSLISSN